MIDRDKASRDIFVHIARASLMTFAKLDYVEATALAEAIHDDCLSDPEFEISFSYIKHHTFENIQYLD